MPRFLQLWKWNLIPSNFYVVTWMVILVLFCFVFTNHVIWKWKISILAYTGTQDLLPFMSNGLFSILTWQGQWAISSTFLLIKHLLFFLFLPHTPHPDLSMYPELQNEIASSATKNSAGPQMKLPTCQFFFGHWHPYSRESPCCLTSGHQTLEIPVKSSPFLSQLP